MKTFRRQIFEELGNLFYAVASKQEVSPMASGELKMLLKKDWLTDPGHIAEDQVSEAAHLIGLTIDTRETERKSPREAFTDFSRFYTEHQEQFSSALKQKVLETAKAIVELFPSHGGSNAFVDELRMLFSESRQSSEVRSP